MKEECVIMGPFGRWFDVPCEPKRIAGGDPGPAMDWEDGLRRSYNIFPLCGVM